MRPIDADALKAVFEEKSSEAVCGVELCKAIISRIDEAPTVDAVPVRHGHACLKIINGREKVSCSLCGYEYERKVGDIHNYCPCCGAKMDGQEDTGKNL